MRVRIWNACERKEEKEGRTRIKQTLGFERGAAADICTEWGICRSYFCHRSNFVPVHNLSRVITPSHQTSASERASDISTSFSRNYIS